MAFTKFGTPVQQDVAFELPKPDVEGQNQAEIEASTSTFEKKKKGSE